MYHGQGAFFLLYNINNYFRMEEVAWPEKLVKQELFSMWI